MRGSVYAIVAVLKNYDDKARQVIMLSIRLHEKDFIAR